MREGVAAIDTQFVETADAADAVHGGINVGVHEVWT